MLTVLAIFVTALPVLAACAPSNSSNPEIRAMLKHCAEEQAAFPVSPKKGG